MQSLFPEIATSCDAESVVEAAGAPPIVSAIEAALIAIWRDVLHCERIDVLDNFFVLGGHSLAALRVVTRIDARFSMSLPVRTLFEAPTVAALTRRILTVRPELTYETILQATALHDRDPAAALAEQGVRALVAVPPTADLQAAASADAAGVLPLSLNQHRLWFIDRLSPGSGVYNVPILWQIDGALDVASLQDSWHALLQRHEQLRARFPAVDGQPRQVIEAGAGEGINVIDMRDADACTAQVAARAVLEADAWRGFDLVAGPICRAQLALLPGQTHLLSITLHHIASDGWTVTNLLRDLAILYEKYVTGDTVALPALEHRYVDHAAKQRANADTGLYDAHCQYWLDRLRDVPDLELPYDRQRPLRPSFNGATLRTVVGIGLLQEVRDLANAHDTTLFKTLLAAFQVLMHRYSDQDDIAVGTPVANREDPATHDLVGFFANIVVIRTNFAGNPGFHEVLQAVQDHVLDAVVHQAMPFDRLVEQLGPERIPGKNPLFQTAFGLKNETEQDLHFTGLVVRRRDLEDRFAKFDLMLTASRGADRLILNWNYNTDLFDAETIARMDRHFRTLLEAIVANPYLPVLQLPLMREAERDDVVERWNRTAADYPCERGIHHLFEDQAARAPQAVALALAQADRMMTYGELNGRANRLASTLIRLGVRPGTPVALYMERSVELVVGLLAVLKAGGAYLPLDPAYPAERLSLMLTDGAAPILLTMQRMSAALPPFDGHVLKLDQDWPETVDDAPDNPRLAKGGDALACVLYTSGSSGVPKGVAVPHRGIVRLLVGADYAQFGADQTTLMMSSICFDASSFELWGALLHGGRCVLMPDQLATIESIGAAIRAHQVSLLWLTSALFNLIVDEAPDTLAGVKQLLFGGEAASVAHVRRAMQRLPALRLINCYGPTESSTFTTTHLLEAVPPAGSVSIPIGRPIANTRVYVLDRAGNPVPIGLPGELWIGGDGVALGYLGQPELTAARFVRDPFVSGSGLMYRSADRVRRLADGSLDYLGRLDQQVKIRGFRIEPGEIEAVLARHVAVAQAVVMAREFGPGDIRLVAYVVGHAGIPQEEALRAHLQSLLPAYMMPRHIMALARMPLQSSGKVDRKALPMPSMSGAAPAGVQSDDPIASAVRTIWQEVLEVGSVGSDDDFFVSGGHSMQAMRMLARINLACGTELPIARLFEAPTVRALADAVRAALAGQTASSAAARDTCFVPVQSTGNRAPLFVVPGAGAELISLHGLARQLGPDQPLYVLDLHAFGKTATERDSLSMASVAARMIDDMRIIQPQGPYHLAGYSLGGRIVYDAARQLLASGQGVGLLALLDCRAPGSDGLHRFGKRVQLHVQFGLRLGGVGAARYLGQRMWNLRRYVRRPVQPVKTPVFDHARQYAGAIELSPDQIQARRLSIEALLVAWARYKAVPIGARMLLIRAVTPAAADEVRAEVESDLSIGWDRRLVIGLDIEVLGCAHGDMLKNAQSGALAAILARHLQPGTTSKPFLKQESVLA